MALYVVPTFSDPSWHQTTTFEGSLYNLQFDYNQRGACWYLSIADADGVDIVNGVKLITGFDLLKKCKDPRRPGYQATTGIAGSLFVISATTDLSPPGQYDLLPGSGRCQVVYMSSDWVALIQTGGAAALATLVSQVAAGTTSTVSPVSTYGQGGPALP